MLIAQATVTEIGEWMLAAASIVGLVAAVLTSAYMLKQLFFPPPRPNGEHVTRADLRLTEQALADLKIDHAELKTDHKELYGYTHQQMHRALDHISAVSLRVRLLEHVVGQRPFAADQPRAEPDATGA